MIPQTAPISVEIVDRRFRAGMAARRLRRRLPVSSRAIGGRLRRRGAIALIIGATSMALSRHGAFRLRQSG